MCEHSYKMFLKCYKQAKQLSNIFLTIIVIIVINYFDTMIVLIPVSKFQPQPKEYKLSS